MLPRHQDMAEGDILIGVASSGPHSNGYSLIRKVVERSGLSWEDPSPFAKGLTLGASLMTPTKIYIKCALPLIRDGLVSGLAHITGGGITDNTPRMLPDNLRPDFDYEAWPRPPVFQWLQETGNISETEMRRAFNCGIGLVLCVKPDHVDAVMARLDTSGETAWVIGTLTSV